jgi:hypothetical protein
VLPSPIDSYLKVDQKVEIMLDHQAAEKVEGLYPQEDHRRLGRAHFHPDQHRALVAHLAMRGKPE